MPLRFPFISKPLYHPLLREVINYTIYYGSPTTKVLGKLKAFDLVIIEPHLYDRWQIVELQEAGTVVLGYISFMESPIWNKDRFKLLKKSDFLLQSGRKIHFEQWDSYLMDLRETHYQDLLMNEIEDQIAAKGFNGIFIDTIGDIDDQILDPSEQNAMRESYKQMLARIKKLYPDTVLIQNRGFFTLEEVLPWIDGFLWEDWNGSWKQIGWMKLRVHAMRKAQKQGLYVLSVSMERDLHHQKEAQKLGFLHAVKEDGYQLL
jgi:hypothetical protein